MLGYADIAIYEFLQTQMAQLNDDGDHMYQGPALTFAWGSPVNSKQALARVAQENNQKAVDLGEPLNSEINGIPGISVFRTGVEKDLTRFNKVQASRGFPIGRTVDGKSINRAKAIAVTAAYTVTVWTKELSDLNAIESILWFADIYKTINITVPTANTTTSTFSFVLDGDPVVELAQELQDKTGDFVWYSLSKHFYVDTFWVQSKNTPMVESIAMKYKTLTSGGSVDFSEEIDLSSS